MDKTDLRVFVKSYLDKEGRQVKQFKNNYPGEDWASSFVKKHKESLTDFVRISALSQQSHDYRIL